MKKITLYLQDTLGDILGISGGYLVDTWWISGGYLADICWISGEYIGDIWWIFGEYLGEGGRMQRGRLHSSHPFAQPEKMAVISWIPFLSHSLGVYNGPTSSYFHEPNVSC